MTTFVRPDGCRLHYELHGAPASPPLILLEGLGGHLPGWGLTPAHLSRELFLIGYDFRGNGGSDDPPGPCSIASFVDDTVALLDEVGIERAHVYGQSLGGMVAQELGLTHPRRVRTLILAATHSGGPHAVRTSVKVPKDRPYLALYAEAFVESHLDRVAEDLRVDASQPHHPLGKRRQWEAMRTFDAFDRLPSLQMPVLVLHGTDDRTVAPANAEILSARIPGAELRWLPGAGHRYQSEQPEVADDAVLDFVRRHADA